MLGQRRTLDRRERRKEHDAGDDGEVDDHQLGQSPGERVEAQVDRSQVLADRDVVERRDHHRDHPEKRDPAAEAEQSAQVGPMQPWLRPPGDHDPEGRRRRRPSGHVPDHQAVGAGAGDRQGDSDDASDDDVGHLGDGPGPKVQLLLHQGELGDAERPQQEVERQDREDVDEGGLVEEGRGHRSEGRGDDHQAGANQDSQGPGGVRLVVDLVRVLDDQRLADAQVRDAVEQDRDDEGEGDEPEVLGGEQPGQDRDRDEDEQLAPHVGSVGPEHAAQGSSPEAGFFARHRG